MKNNNNNTRDNENVKDFSNETRRQANARINNLLVSIPKETKEDRSKIYSWDAVRDRNELIEYKNGEVDKFNRVLKYCKECNSFTCHQTNHCEKCRAAKTGLGNPEIHQKTIDSQIKNGTFNMLNPEVQKNKSSNKNIKFEHIEKFCPECNAVTKHRIWPNGKTRCCKCDFKDNGQRIIYCETCGKDTLHNGSKCTICHPESAVLHYEYCDTCGKITYHNGNKCTVCHPESMSGNARKNFITKNNVKTYKGIPVDYLVKQILNKEVDINDYPGFEIRLGRVCYNGTDIITEEKINLRQNFQILDNVRYFKNEPVDIIISKLESGECNIIDDYPGWNKRFGRWCYFLEDVLTGEKYPLSGSNFETLNDIKYIYDNSIGDYVPWNEFKKDFENRKDSSKDIKELKNLIQQDYPNRDVIIQPTFRTQDSENWNGAKSAFEMSLTEKNIEYFVYIKFYIEDNNKGNDNKKCIKPLVCGKSGSLLVNESGSDVNFSKNIKDGPSRVFLYESNSKCNWYKEGILIINCRDDESEALRIESEIQKKYNLFGS
mgnify:CR=1 FL=1